MEAYIKSRTPKETVEEKINVPIKKNKTTEVLKHLKVNGSITSMEAFKLYGATRLSAIIFALRKKGYEIVTQEEACTDRYGHRCDFARYILEEE